MENRDRFRQKGFANGQTCEGDICNWTEPVAHFTPAEVWWNGPRVRFFCLHWFFPLLLWGLSSVGKILHVTLCSEERLLSFFRARLHFLSTFFKPNKSFRVWPPPQCAWFSGHEPSEDQSTLPFLMRPSFSSTATNHLAFVVKYLLFLFFAVALKRQFCTAFEPEQDLCSVNLFRWRKQTSNTRK